MIAYGMLCWGCHYFGFRGNFILKVGVGQYSCLRLLNMCLFTNSSLLIHLWYFLNKFGMLRCLFSYSFVICLLLFVYKNSATRIYKRLWFDIQCYCRLHLHWFSLFINYYNLWVVLYDSLWNVMLGLPLFWILWEFFFEGRGWLVQLFESYITHLYMIMQDGHGIRYYKFELEIQKES